MGESNWNRLAGSVKKESVEKLGPRDDYSSLAIFIAGPATLACSLILLLDWLEQNT